MFLEELRHTEFARLSRTETTYFDYTGAALYPESLVRKDAERLLSRVTGNPHSAGGPSEGSAKDLEDARRRTLAFFDADAAEYEVVFTANASAAMRLLADAFPFRAGSRLVMTADNHNSVNGLRLPAERRGAAAAYVPLGTDLRSRDPGEWLLPAGGPSLLAYPAQSNFSGVQHPLRWVVDAHRRGYKVLLDAAAYAPTNRLSLRETPADFVAISFYKMFGYPTGVGALLARREALALLERDFFAGGTVQFVSLQNLLVRKKPGGEGLEDGTPNFLAMPAVADGLDWLDGIGIGAAQAHVSAMTDRLLKGLAALGGKVHLYGPPAMGARGGTVPFNLSRKGKLMTFEAVEAQARAAGIWLRGGCFCNPGAAEKAFAMDAERMRACLEGTFSITKLREHLQGPVGALRASVGIATNEQDIGRLLAFLNSMTN